MAEKKSTKKPQKSQPATGPKPAGPETPKVIGPGVVKRPKREPAAPAAGGTEDLGYTPSEQVFRRRR